MNKYYAQSSSTIYKALSCLESSFMFERFTRYWTRKLSSSRTTTIKMSNKLGEEKSPYLLQHQHNPVHWLPWNEETISLARSLRKPIFLSSGYSTCHWCHVMERESFENQRIADIMNQHFISIKLDREEHPDIDRIYMTFVQAMTGSGGWPMSVWLTPELKPFYGGTYFPPDSNFGRPGFGSLLESIAEQWNENVDQCIESSTKILQVLEKTAKLPIATEIPKGAEIGSRCNSQLSRSYEPTFGGFSEQPKFPQPVNLQFLIQWSQKEPNCFKMVERTLKCMRKGGIYDHLGKGFCRYSTDKKWHVPHFEKMLYDESQLTSVYLNAYLHTKEEFYAGIGREILEYVSRDMSTEEGGFYSAEDADSLPTPASTEKKEGAFYVFEKTEIEEILADLTLPSGKKGPAADLFCARYGVKPDGNVNPHQDPHDELKKKNVLFEAKELNSLATQFEISEGEVESVLSDCAKRLFDWRNANRPRPHLDNKFIASWNGLMMTAYAQAGFVLADEGYVQRAVKAAEFIEAHLIQEAEVGEGMGRDLLRTCYSDGVGPGHNLTNLNSPIFGCVDDFSNVIGGLLELFQVTGAGKWLRLAVELQAKQNELFWDEQSGGYYTTRATDKSAIVRMKDDDDGAEPSSNSTSLINLLRLQHLFPDNTTYSSYIKKIFLQFGDRLSKIPITLPLMTSALLAYEGGIQCYVVVGKKLKESPLLEALRAKLLPTGSLVILIDLADPENVALLKTIAPSIESQLASYGKLSPPDGEVVLYAKKKSSAAAGTVAGAGAETVIRNMEELNAFYGKKESAST